ncbi:hypothetical protein CR513_55550, partial [Mucuna pruriens]
MTFCKIFIKLTLRGLKHNLLSISQLYDSRYNVSFNKGECIVKDCNGSIIFSAKRQNNLYKIDLTDLTNQNKLGHAILRLISKMKKHNLVRGLPSLVSKNVVFTSRPLEIDLFGPTRIVSLDGKHYRLLSSLYSINVFKMKKILKLSLSEVIMGENLKMKTFSSFVKNNEFFIIFPIQEHLNKMVLWKGKTNIFKRWLEQC